MQRLHHLTWSLPVLQLLARGVLSGLHLQARPAGFLRGSGWSDSSGWVTCIQLPMQSSCAAVAGVPLELQQWVGHLLPAAHAVLLRCSCWSAPGATAVDGSPAPSCTGRRRFSSAMLRTEYPQQLGKAAMQVGPSCLLL